MGGYGVQVALVMVLVLVNAVFSGSEMALVSLRESQVERLRKSSRGGRVLARLTGDPNRFLATIQLFITLANFLASAAAAVSLAEPLVRPLSGLGSAARPTAVVAVTVLLTFVSLVLGELAPKRIALLHAERWALSVARPLNVLASVSRPVIWLLARSTDVVVRLTGNDPSAVRDDVSTEEIRDLIAARRDFSAEQQTIISGAFEIVERTLREILVSRRDVFALPSSTPASAALKDLMGVGHSRAPVVGRGGLDEVIGVVHLRDLVDVPGTVGDHARPATFLPETQRVSDALRQMRQQRDHFAFVVDERGGVDGIVTMEDLVEEIVGEIYDETDRDVQGAVHEPDGAVLLVGTFPVHDLKDVGIELQIADSHHYATVAGMVLARLGHIPTAPGERVRIDGYEAEVAEVTGRAISQVRLRSAVPGRGSDSAGDG
ncbi:MAG: hemolysin family protein [Angustibacter sp.]